MAKLDDIAESLNVQIDIPSQTSFHEKPIGKKRRAWISSGNDEEIKEVYRPLIDKGSINPVDKPHSSTPYINPIHQPLIDKGSINPVSKQLDLNLKKLRGNPLIIAQYIFELVKKASSSSTGKVTLLEMMKTLEMSRDSARTGLRFLLKNNLVKRVDFHAGKNGWSKYEIKKSLFNELEEAYQKGFISPLKLKGSNSSSNNNIRTTTIDPIEEWNFDIVPYAKFGFTSSQIKQLASLGVISATDVEQSLIEFNFDLENNSLPTIKGGKVSFLMGLFRKGIKYTSESYLNEQEAAIYEMARRVESKRKRLLEEKFLAWEAGISDGERKEIEKQLPTQLMVLNHAHGLAHPEIKKWFFDYFIQRTD